MLIVDILLTLKENKNTMKHLRILSTTLQDKKEYVKFSACEFWHRQVIFLGHVVTTKSVQVDPREVEAVLKWEWPTIVTEVCCFLGLDIIKVSSSINQFD